MKWALLLLFAVLPLQWFLVPGLPLGPQRLHLLALLLFAGVFFLRHRARVCLPVLSVALPFVAANAALVAVWAASGIYHGSGVRGPFQEAIQLVVFVAVGTVVFRGARGLDPGVIELARWAALAAAASLLLALSVSMVSNGINPAATFARTLAQGDPAILQRELFRSAFGGFGFDADTVQGNVRHEVFGAVLSAMCLSAVAVRLRPFASSPALWVYRGSLTLGAVLIVVSLSRSVLLAAAMWPLLAMLRALLQLRISGRHVAAVFVGAVAAVVGVVSGFAAVLWVRFTEDTVSYEGRDALLEQALRDIPDHLLTGVEDVSGVSSHVFLVDSFLRAGVLGGLLAILITGLVVGLWVLLIVRLRVEPSWMVPVTAALALPVVRLFTSGGGVIPPVQWVGLGVVAGFMAYRAAGIDRREHDTEESAVDGRLAAKRK
jgi:hypothetical protein